MTLPQIIRDYKSSKCPCLQEWTCRQPWGKPSWMRPGSRAGMKRHETLQPDAFLAFPSQSVLKPISTVLSALHRKTKEERDVPPPRRTQPRSMGSTPQAWGRALEGLAHARVQELTRWMTRGTKPSLDQVSHLESGAKDHLHFPCLYFRCLCIYKTHPSYYRVL